VVEANFADARPRGPGRARGPCRARQLLDPQDAGHPTLACRPPAFRLHFAPTSSSWLNLVERWFAELTTTLPRRGAHRSVRQLNADTRAWIETWNDDPKPGRLDQDRRPDLESIARNRNRINESRH
jgi:hypothetical protein